MLKGDSWRVFWFDKNFKVGFLADAVYGGVVFQTLCDYNHAQGPAIHTRVDDLDPISRSKYVRIINCKLFLDFYPL